jgi:hypothetical protein
MSKKAIRELENTLIGLQGGFTQYRSGIDESFVPHGFAIARQKLQAARSGMEQLGLFELCRDAIDRAEELVKLGPEYDEEAELLILNANRELMEASGSYDRTSALLREPGVTRNDFKPDPDQWEADDAEGEMNR